MTGHFSQHFLSIRRDRRKELNQIINSVREYVASEIEIRRKDYKELAGEFQVIRKSLHWWQRKSFDKACEDYKNSKGKSNRGWDDRGRLYWKDYSLISHTSANLLKYLIPR